MQVEQLSIGFAEPLVERINLSIRADTRIGLLGFNGSGKSTLLRVLSEQHSPLAGEITRAKKLKVGYYAQHQVDELNQQSTLLSSFSSSTRKPALRRFATTLAALISGASASMSRYRFFRVVKKPASRWHGSCAVNRICC